MSLTNFSKTLWSAGLLANVRKSLVASSIVTKDYEGEIKEQGSIVKILRPAAVSAQAYSGSIVYSNPTSTSLDLAVNQANYSAFKIADQIAATTSVNLVDGYTQEAAYKLAELADGYVLSLTNVAGYDTTSTVINLTAATPTPYRDLLTVARKLDNANTPRGNRYIIVAPELYEALQADDKFVLATDIGQEIRMAGSLGMIAGFNVFMSANLVTDASKASNLIGAAAGTQTHIRCHAGSLGNIAYADSILKMRAMELEGSFDAAVSGLHVFGASILKPEQTVRVDVRTV
jgi:hypothetical protein